MVKKRNAKAKSATKQAPVTISTAAAERMRRYRSKGSNLTIQPYRVSARRRACQRDFKLFCHTYAAQSFPLPDSPDQMESKERIQHTVLSGGRQAEAAPRGDGKTQRAKWGLIWATLQGHWRFAVAMAATSSRSKQLLAEIAQEIADNDLLAEDWPDVCFPIREALGKPQRAKHILINGNPCRLECSAERIVFPTSGLCQDTAKPCDGSVIGQAGILGAIRGLRYTTATGETLRPDGVLMDDIQTRRSAKSVPEREKILRTIRGDVMRLAGPDRELAALAMVTVIERNDAADQLLDNKRCPEWRGVRKKMLYAFPTDAALWREYTSMRRNGLLAGDGGLAATEFYRANQAAMDAGAQVGWVHRYRKDSGEISAIQCAQNILIDDGEEAFQAECQNDPIERSYSVVDLKPEIVATRLNGLPAGVAPALARTANVFIDVNKGWLAWVAMAWQADMTGAVLGYGTWPEHPDKWDDKKTHTESLEVYMARLLLELAPRLLKPSAFSVPLDRALVDIGWGDMQDPMLGAIAHLRTAQRFDQVIPARGSPKFRYQADVVRYEFAQFQEWPGKGKVLVANTNWHKMRVHSAFAQQPGTPGSITLYGDSSAHHHEFAKSICAEKLTRYIEGVRDGDAGLFDWERVPAQRNEMLDCVTGCRVAASWWAASTGNSIALPAPRAATTAAPQPTAAAPKLQTRPSPVSYSADW